MFGVIHPTAIIHPNAQIDPSVEVGPYAVIDEDVVLGTGCIVGPYVYLTGSTKAGSGNRFFAGCVIGEAPQDLKYRGNRTALVIGNDNVFREHVTVHRSAGEGESTLIGSRNFLMAHSHVAHDCHLGDQIVIANGAMLGGHSTVDERAVISGNCLVHQYVRVGTLAMMQGGSAISKDLPPYTMARGDNGICGLNLVGLRRAGLAPAERLELKRLYHALFRSGLNLRQAMAKAEPEFLRNVSRTMLDFLRDSKRGVCFDTGRRSVSEPDEPVEA